MGVSDRHRCHARGCQESVSHDKLMCLRHWRLVPKPEQDAVWHTLSIVVCAFGFCMNL